MSNELRISSFKNFCASAFRRFVLVPAKAAVARVANLFRGPVLQAEKKKDDSDSKWVRKVDLDLAPFLPDGPRPIDPLPSDPQPARRAIPSDFAENILAGQRNYLPPRTFEAGSSAKASFAVNAAVRMVVLNEVTPRLPANDVFVAPARHFG